MSSARRELYRSAGESSKHRRRRSEYGEVLRRAWLLPPNSEGIVQLDGAVMRGTDCRFGAVAALEGYSKPISVAKRVLEQSQVNILVGSGATNFAKTQGFVLESTNLF
eukprot:Em0256g1a